jgi:diguanylate cyclase (GGDEF)-like protein
MSIGGTQAPESPAGLQDRLNALGQEFGNALGSKVKEIRRIWSLVPAAPSLQEAQSALVKIHDIVHGLAGAGETFGFPLVSKAAAPLDGLFRLVTEQSQGLTGEEIAQIEVLIQSLEDAICAPQKAIEVDDVTASAAPTQERRESMFVLLLGTRGDELQTLQEVLSSYGYRCHVIRDAADVPAEVAQGAAGILYADISDGDAHLKLVRKVMALSHLPLILASSNAGFSDRLKAVKSGATVFLPKPFDVEELVERIGQLEETKYERPYRVVIAEDDGPLAAFYQLTLEHAGMETRVVRRPSKLLDTLSGFDPDLIVMDLYMPECTGLDLAQIVRQFPAYTTVPILFLSTESRLDLQLRARHLGADDFLPKPLQPGQLLSAITSRANRYRDLKKLTDRDSLTGLLNHTNILRNLEREMSVASRTQSPVAFAMVDIDHFKSVNDTYGHVVGDQVILRVTHLMRNRLRRVDYVGRYGGEEFAIVMPNTDAAAAKEVVDKLREAARELEHKAEAGTFHVTFSAGIATYPQHNSVLDVAEAADEALYKAKRAGRNQVMIAGEG